MQNFSSIGPLISEILYFKLILVYRPKFQNVPCSLSFEVKKINPWRQSPEEPRPTEVVAARWQYRGLVVSKAYPSTLISVFLTGFRYFSYQVATQLSSRGWMGPVPDPILPEKFPRYSRESNPGPLGWQSDVPTTIPNSRSPYELYDII